MSEQKPPLYSGPIFIAPAIILFCLAVVEKSLVIMSMTIPFIDVYPRQLLEWALILLAFEIAFTLRQTLELLRDRGTI